MIVLGLGTNLGERYTNMNIMLEKLADLFESEMICSPLYETAPVGVDNHAIYLNRIVAGEFSGTPEELLQKTQQIELELGRTDKGLLQPRTADIDILLFNSQIVKQPNLTIPHHALFDRRFEIEGVKSVVPQMKVPGMDILFEEYDVPDEVTLQELTEVIER